MTDLFDNDYHLNRSRIYHGAQQMNAPFSLFTRNTDSA
ncbi:hypothetical protein J529_4622, partial [Acinetobacter baumannii 99063]